KIKGTVWFNRYDASVGPVFDCDTPPPLRRRLRGKSPAKAFAAPLNKTAEMAVVVHHKDARKSGSFVGTRPRIQIQSNLSQYVVDVACEKLSLIDLENLGQDWLVAVPKQLVAVLSHDTHKLGDTTIKSYFSKATQWNIFSNIFKDLTAELALKMILQRCAETPSSEISTSLGHLQFPQKFYRSLETQTARMIFRHSVFG
ncbi:unnamed protein product, partial [Thlaspi arvense]